jgi:hypothetical protein
MIKMLTVRRIIVLLAGAIFVLSLIPFRTTIVREWEIQFVDEGGNPIPGVHVEEVCQHYTFSEHNICADYPDSRQISDFDGKVRFSAKSISLNAISRIFRAAFFYLTLIAHGSVGIDAYLIVSAPAGYDSEGLIRYLPDKNPPAEIVLRSRDTTAP